MKTEPVRRIPIARPDIGAREVELVNEVLASDVLALGPFAEALEGAAAAVAGGRHCVACSGGTAGLHIGVRALGWRTGDEVITTPFSLLRRSTGAICGCGSEGGRHRGGEPHARSAGSIPRQASTRGLLPVRVFAAHVGSSI